MESNNAKMATTETYGWRHGHIRPYFMTSSFIWLMLENLRYPPLYLCYHYTLITIPMLSLVATMELMELLAPFLLDNTTITNEMLNHFPTFKCYLDAPSCDCLMDCSLMRLGTNLTIHGGCLYTHCEQNCRHICILSKQLGKRHNQKSYLSADRRQGWCVNSVGCHSIEHERFVMSFNKIIM